MRRATLGLVVAALVATVALAAGSAQAAPPTPVVIQVHEVFADNGGPFTISPDVGLCTTGTTSSQTLATGNGSHTIFHVVKTFTCDDGSGAFTMHLQAFGWATDSADHFTWTIVSGTGDYTKLHGSGSGVGVGFGSGVDDTYTGRVNFT